MGFKGQGYLKMLIYSAKLSGSVTILAYRYVLISVLARFLHILCHFFSKLAKEVVTLNDRRSVLLFKCKV